MATSSGNTSFDKSATIRSFGRGKSPRSNGLKKTSKRSRRASSVEFSSKDKATSRKGISSKHMRSLTSSKRYEKKSASPRQFSLEGSDLRSDPEGGAKSPRHHLCFGHRRRHLGRSSPRQSICQPPR